MTDTQLTATQRRAIRSHAQKHVRKLSLDLDVADAQWSELASQKAEARRAAREVANGLTDATPESRAEEIEAAHDALVLFVDMIDAEMDARTARSNRNPSNDIDLDRRPRFENKSSPAFDGGDDTRAAPAYALESRQSLRTWAEARSHEHDAVSAGAFLRALTTGPKTDAERRALGAGTDAAGGFTVPTLTSAELIDLARSEMVLAAAGARIVPLTSDQNVIAKVLTDPVPAWRAENAAVNESDPTFGAVTLAPKSIAVLVKASVELMQDSLNLEAELPRILARALAHEIDRAGLVGSGTAPEPKGIVNYSGLTANTYAGGNLASYAPLLNARGALHGANERMTAVVMAARDENALAGLVASDGQPLNMPRALEGVAMLHTTALPVDGGAGDDESQIIAGDFSQLLMGIRSEIRVEILRERFIDNLQFGLIAHARVDFAAARESAFTVLDAVTG
ncbi:MAG: phage major capsid protein [Yoonia sp.]